MKTAFAVRGGRHVAWDGGGGGGGGGSGSGELRPVPDLDAWIASALDGRWTGWYCYNDAPPPRPGRPVPRVVVSACKGIVLWNDALAVWMVHSVPGWPVGTPLQRVPSSAVPTASFAVWRGDISRLSRIEAQIDLMGATVYAGARSIVGVGVSRVAVLQRAILDKNTDHLACNAAWGRDMYESMGRCAFVPGTTIAVSDDGTWASFGDFCAGSQCSHRGGGALTSRDAALVAALKSVL